MKQYRDKSLQEFVECKENCRRRVLLDGIGGTLVHTVNPCCDCCSTDGIEARFDVLKPSAPCTRKRRRAVQHVSNETREKLKNSLLELRKKIIDDQPGYNMLVRDSVLADATIEQLCVECRYFSSVDDIQIFGVRSEHKARVWDVIKSTLSISASVSSSQRPHKRCR